MNQRQRQIDGLHKPDTIPRYRWNKRRRYRQREWEVYVDGRKEWGDLEYVCGEYAKTCLYYPFHLRGKEKEGWEYHEHHFADVLQTLIEELETFDIHGFEEYYSKQQMEFLDTVQKKLLDMKLLTTNDGTEVRK